jgi:hypothetical protein
MVRGLGLLSILIVFVGMDEMSVFHTCVRIFERREGEI